MGGGTGTGAAPVIAKIAKEIGALTIGVVTKPFKREGAKRLKLAEIGFQELKNECDSIVTILNERLLSIIDRRASKRDAYKKVDNILHQAVSGISNMIISSSDVNVDFADLTTIMSHKGIPLMGIGHKKGEGSAYEALVEAIESPLLDDTNITEAKGLLINFVTNENYPLVDLDEAMQSVLGELMEDENVTIIQGESTDNSLEDEEIKITLIATGFDSEKPANRTDKPSDKKINLGIAHQKVVGGDDLSLELSGEDIDIPTYLRYSRD